jgi:hypothetical protein
MMPSWLRRNSISSSLETCERKRVALAVLDSKWLRRRFQTYGEMLDGVMFVVCVYVLHILADAGLFL